MPYLAVRRRWWRLVLLLLFSVAVAIALAVPWLLIDGSRMDADEHYSWRGWHGIWLLGLHVVILVLLLVWVLRRLIKAGLGLTGIPRRRT